MGLEEELLMQEAEAAFDTAITLRARAKREAAGFDTEGGLGGDSNMVQRCMIGYGIAIDKVFKILGALPGTGKTGEAREKLLEKLKKIQDGSS